MRIITANFAQFIWIAVILAGLAVSPESSPDYIDTNSEFIPEPTQSSYTLNRAYSPKIAALEEHIATFDVGIPYTSASDSAEELAETPSEPADTGHTDSKLGSRGGGKNQETLDTSNAKNTTKEPPTGGQETSVNTSNDYNASNRHPNSRQGFNQIVLSIIKTYKGRFPYLLNQDYANYNGVTENIYYDGRLFLKAHPSGSRASHCSGITFEVFFKAMQEWNRQRSINADRIGSLSYTQLQDFMLQWYVANGPKEQSNLTTALTQYGLGQRITNMNAAQPGDFIDFSRENNTGHTAVFLSWVWEDGQIVGLKYWSSQGSTGGISSNTEYFNVLRKDGSKYGKVMIDKLYIGRVTP